MKQITDTVNNFLGYILGAGLICFISFVLLTSSAYLNNSPLGDSLADTAGQTARTARTESFNYWGKFGGKVAEGLGVQPGSIMVTIGNSNTANPTTVPVVATQAPAVNPTPTPVPVVSSASARALLFWRGLNESGQPDYTKVKLHDIQALAEEALRQNPNDAQAKWLLEKVQSADCIGTYDQMLAANYQDPNLNETIQTTAKTLLAKCNPRLVEAIARSRWANIYAWINRQPLDETQAKIWLSGLVLNLGSKGGAARELNSEDQVDITVDGVAMFNLSTISGFKLKVATIDEILGRSALDPYRGNFKVWEPNGPYQAEISDAGGALLPANLPEPALPPMVVEKPTQLDTNPNQPVSKPGIYIVQQGDTVSSIARKFNITNQALINANPDTLGFNPNYITIGMELKLP